MDYAVRNLTNSKLELNYARDSDPGLTQDEIVWVTPVPASFRARVSNIGGDKIELVPEPADGKFVPDVHLTLEAPLEA